ncbi:hypothetical protein [Chryseobacterium polytrichastri]|uniref:Uncharacterized protein n=1 Tax=Chryseobacterium polytrichastri TaxID=1302687 RepID=A0A1M7JCU1_9FLAO|nr:hypothetical protein [Chryseobacterium polytrichastri]SHM50804.1 hypothetical protein SAMN05444267_105134 [Chryseobacterium polytrichastri]
MNTFTKYMQSILLGISLMACSQTANSVNQNSKITADNIADEISKQVKYYPSEKIYTLGYSNDKCYFEMFVDGIKLTKAFNKALGNTAVEINHVLFKSGKHTISYKMYPLGKSKEYDEVFNTLVEDTDLDFDLKSYDLKNEKAPDTEYMTYSLPKKKEEIAKGYIKEKFVGVGKTFYEGNVDVTIDVPYNSEAPFENAMDLRKMNKNELETKLLKKYKEVWSIYQNKEYDNIAKLEYNSLKDLYVSTYESKEVINKNINILFTEMYKSSTFKMQPIEKYKLEFFADGKLVALMLDTDDNRLRGNTALWAKVNYDGGTRGIFLNRYFYIPQGKSEFMAY